MGQQTQPLETARKKLGEVIRFHREARQLTTRRAADMVGCSQSKLEAWESGLEVPEGRDWGKLTGILHRKLGAYIDLHNRARIEAAAETAQREQSKVATTTKSNGLTHTPLAAIGGIRIAPDPKMASPSPDARTVNPGQSVTYVEPEPRKPWPDARKAAQAALPKGYRSFEQRERRLSFVRDLVRARPNIHERGADSIHEALMRTFGVGIDTGDIKRIRKEVDAERAIAAVAPLPPPEGFQRRDSELVVAVPQPKPAATDDTEANIRAAVQLVLEAVPHLRSFTIAVDDHGHADVAFTTREVRVVEQTGAIKVIK
jgi:transcriptional regulator with XRE-family HTH domain